MSDLPDQRLAEAVRFASEAAESDLSDDHTRRLIENGISTLQIAARRIHRERLARDGDEPDLIEYEQWVGIGSPGDFETVRQEASPDGE